MFDVIEAPFVTKAHAEQLRVSIAEHHALYLNLFGPLSQTFHNIVHYPDLLLRNGPASEYLSDREESHHRILKQIIKNSCNNQNVLMSIGIRYQLGRMNLQYYKYEDDKIEIGKNFSYVRIQNVKYKKNSVILIDLSRDAPVFGKIERIFSLNNKIHFECFPLYVVGFDKHFHAYTVLLDFGNLLSVSSEEILCRKPCVMYEYEDTTYIVTKT